MRRIAIAMLIAFPLCSLAQNDTIRNKKDGGYLFTQVKSLEATDVKNQFKSGTCWSFSGMSLFESEMIRMGQEPINFSEMFFVRKAYELKAERYVRMHGKAQFGPGGQFHDVVQIAQEYGVLTEEQYGGQPVSYGKPIHAEMDAMTKAVVNVVVKNPNKKLSPYWQDAFTGVVDAYLGELPKDVDPKQVAESTSLDWDKYIEVTSFSHMPYYEQSVLLIPDNWNYSKYHNLPIDELVDMTVKAIDAGFTLGWDGDVSDRGFSFRNGLAIYPMEPWETMSKAQRDTVFDAPGKEMMVSQEQRQALYDNYSTTDDHLMHLTGYCKDQNGTLYFIIKNSWGDERNDCGGYLYMSEAYFRAKTLALMLHQDGVDKTLAKKLKL